MTAASLDFTGENLLRELAPQVLGAVIRRFGDFSAAEDAVQEALLAAAVQWPPEGVPDNPRGWLIQVAARRMTDHLRTELSRRRREGVVVMQVPAAPLSLAHLEPSFAEAGEPQLDHDDTHGELIPLAEQDRTLWDRKAISQPRSMMVASARLAPPSQGENAWNVDLRGRPAPLTSTWQT